MKWKIPPKIKIYEALGSIGDKRIEVTINEAKVYSSSKGKFYTIKYDSKSNSIMCNDNGSYWQGYLGYPAIAFLMLNGRIKYSSKYSEALKDIMWKDINVKLKNDFSKAEAYVLDLIKKKRFSEEEFLGEIDNIYEQIKVLNINLLGEKQKPPEGY